MHLTDRLLTGWGFEQTTSSAPDGNELNDLAEEDNRGKYCQSGISKTQVSGFPCGKSWLAHTLPNIPVWPLSVSLSSPRDSVDSWLIVEIKAQDDLKRTSYLYLSNLRARFTVVSTAQLRMSFRLIWISCWWIPCPQMSPAYHQQPSMASVREFVLSRSQQGDIHRWLLEVKGENNLLTHYCHVTTVSKCRRGTSQFAVCGNVKPLKTERVNQPHPTVAYTNQTAHDLLEERKKKIFLTKMMMMRQTEDLDNDHPPPQISPQSALF